MGRHESARRAAIITGLLTWLLAGVIGVIYVIKATMVQQSWIPDPSGAFSPFKNIKMSARTQTWESDRAFTGNGFAFAAWKIESRPQEITRAARTDVIRDYRGWSADAEAVQLRKAMSFFEKRQEFQNMREVVNRLMGAADVRYLIIHFGASEAGVTDAGLWLCSPEMQEVVFLESTI